MADRHALHSGGWPAPPTTDRLRHLVRRQRPLRQRIAHGLGGSALLIFVSKALTLVTSVLLARWMGAGGYGVYATAIALVALLTVPTALGLPTLTVRLLASYPVHGRWTLMKGFLVRSHQAILLLSLLICAVAAGVILLLDSRLGLPNSAVFLTALILVPLMGLSALRSSALRGLHHVVLGQVPESLLTPGLFLALICGWEFIGGGSAPLSPQTAILGRIAGVLIAFMAGAWMLVRVLPAPLRAAKPEYDDGAWRRSALPLLFIGGMSIINMQTDVLMLAAIEGSAAAGIYQAATRGAELVAFSLIVVNMVIQPTISRLYAAGQLVQLQHTITVATRGSVAFALPLALGLISFGGPILSSVFGDEFEKGGSALAILCCGQLVNAAAGSVAQVLNMTGHERESALGLTIGAATNVTFNATLIPLWGLSGAAIATCLSLVTWNMVLVYLAQKRTGLSTSVVGPIGTRVVDQPR